MSRGLERFLGQNAGKLMLAVAVSFVSLEPRDDHPRPFRANDPNQIGQSFFFVPTGHGFSKRLGVAVVGKAGEIEIIEPVVASG